MRTLFSLVSLYTIGAVASHLGATSEDWRDYRWSYEAENTAEYYKDNGLEPPAVASPITSVESQKSYIVKLECLGCPFRVRTYTMGEHWQEPPQDNSLLLNFTIDTDKRSMLLNGKSIVPLAPLPTRIYAFQTPANLSASVMQKMVDMKMLDESWNVGTKYGTFDLSYEHTRMKTEDRFIELLQFDVISVDISGTTNPGGAELNQPDQKIVQLRLGRGSLEDGLKIESIELVKRSDRIQHTKLPCGRDAPQLSTIFRSTEWDYYGQQNTWTRTWHLISWTTMDWFFDHIPLFIVLGIAFGGYSLVRWIIARQRRTAEGCVEDAEAALLDTAEDTDLLQEPEEIDEAKVPRSNDSEESLLN